jgi:hypothetical protein
MKKCVILLPMFFNDGREVPVEMLDAILDEVYDLFGGFTVADTGYGEYPMRSGRKAHDVLLEIWVAVEPARIRELRKLVAKCAATLRQESIYFEVGGDVELLGPSPNN